MTGAGWDARVSTQRPSFHHQSVLESVAAALASE